jgi:hypothetical protein
MVSWYAYVPEKLAAPKLNKKLIDSRTGLANCFKVLRYQIS